ncbi:unnamed protein product [Trichobilharzia szidati]|nr:unnamed protein product [Trichobilharzia szidati]CAH8847248.1 unnamed protein product [Trichobilharzia szidati]
MHDYVVNIEPENTKYSLFQSHTNSVVFLENGAEITAMCSFSNLLFVGTSKGVVFQLVFQELYADDTYFHYRDVLSKRICSKAISRLQTSSKKSTIAIATDEDLLLRDAEQLETLNFIPSFKTVSSFHLCSFDDEKEKLCIGFKSGLIQVHHILVSTCVLVFEMKLTEIPKCICLSPQFLCVALDNCYVSINLSTSATVELLRSVKESIRNYIAYFNQNEFIVSGPGSLAIIVDANGVSHRAPLQLSSNVIDVFVWRNYFFTVTDEFFTIHNILTQSQLQTVNLQKSSVACFSTDAHLVFIINTSSYSSDDSSIKIHCLGPERWDRVARRFILTGCLKQAFSVQQNERNRLSQVMQIQVEKFKSEQQLFNMRRQRVLGLLGFYYFELADLKKAAYYFEESIMDIREILFRYTDLLPKGCYFMPNWFYRLHYTSDSTPNDDRDGQTSGINLVTDLCILRAAEDSDTGHDLSSTSLWLSKYEQFLFNFLRKNHKSKFVEKYLHFVETALVKLYVRLQQSGIQPYLYELIIDPKTSYDNCDQSAIGLSSVIQQSSDNNDGQGLVDLISSLIHIDVEDLIVYLEKNNAYHALALIYHWQGNLFGALEIWRKLVYNELSDPGFPGVPFYVLILSHLSATNSTDSSKQMLPGEVLHSSNDVNYEFPVYTELVWNHFLEALNTGHEMIAGELMIRFPIPVNYINSRCVIPFDQFNSNVNAVENMLAPSQILSPNHIIQKLLSSHPNLAITYLKHLCCCLPNCHPENHNLLAKLYLDALFIKLKSTDVLSDQTDRQIRELRIEFCQLIRYSLLISHEILLNRLLNESLSVQKKLAYELAILEGKVYNHTKALKYLINDMNDYKAALYYCLTFSQQPVQHKIGDVDAIASAMVHGSTAERWSPAIIQLEENYDNQSMPSMLFTSFIDICFDKLDADLNDSCAIKGIILSLLNNSKVKFNFTKVLSRVPSGWNLLEIGFFLQKALRCTLRQWSELHLEYALTKCNTKPAALDLPKASESLVIQENTACSKCHQLINVNVPSYNFAWLVSENKVAHITCLSMSLVE